MNVIGSSLPIGRDRAAGRPLVPSGAAGREALAATAAVLLSSAFRHPRETGNEA